MMEILETNMLNIARIDSIKKVVRHELFGIDQNPDNPTAVLVLRKRRKERRN